MQKQIAAALMLVALTGCVKTTVEAGGDEVDAGLTVVGVGRVDAAPDTLVLLVRVRSREDSPTEALDATSESARGLLDALKDGGVEDRDIQTVSLDLGAERRYVPEERRYSPTGQHTATQSFRVKVRELDRAGEIISGVVASSGPGISVTRMSLEIGDPDRAQDDARNEAVADARRKAEAMAAEAGIELGATLSVQEADELNRGYYPYGAPAAFDLGRSALSLDEAAAVLPALPRIEAGTQEIVVRVRVRYAIS